MEPRVCKIQSIVISKLIRNFRYLEFLAKLKLCRLIGLFALPNPLLAILSKVKLTLGSFP